MVKHKSAVVLAALVAAAGMNCSSYAGIVTLAGAGPFSLASLIPSGGNTPAIQVDDKLFYNFKYSTTGLDMPTAANVNVSAFHETIGTTPTEGLQFSGAFGSLAGNGASDALIQYEVMVLDPAVYLISDAHLDGDPVVDDGNGKITVTETWHPDQGNSKILIKSVVPGSDRLLDGVIFATPTDHLFVQKDIQATGSTSLSLIDQTYSQTPTGGGNPPPRIPEPASLSLLAIAGAGLLLKRRSR